MDPVSEISEDEEEHNESVATDGTDDGLHDGASGTDSASDDGETDDVDNEADNGNGGRTRQTRKSIKSTYTNK